MIEIGFPCLLLFGLTLRLLTILYGEWQDKHLVVPFTDVDYQVFTDAARFVTQGESPYLRDTYRYPPILAWLLIPNITVHQAWGKLLFSLLDLLVSAIIKKLVHGQGFSEKTSTFAALFWLFNPISVIISTRGNSDSLIAAVVLLSLYAVCNKRPASAGFLLGLAIHIRLYPIVFSLPMYLSLRTREPSKNVYQQIKSFIPNSQQIALTSCCIMFLASATAFCYHLYGHEYLHESILYHLSRKDTRHNFSLFFYLLYLNPDQPPGLLFLPQALLLFVFAIAFHHKRNLPFCLFAQSFAVVTYNPVVTSQYWIWVVSLLAPSIPRLKLPWRQVLFLCTLWLLSQLAWLVPAYLLEFRGRNTFLFIWFQGVGVFCANLAVLVRLIRGYDLYKQQIKQD